LGRKKEGKGGNQVGSKGGDAHGVDQQRQILDNCAKEGGGGELEFLLFAYSPEKKKEKKEERRIEKRAPMSEPCASPEERNLLLLMIQEKERDLRLRKRCGAVAYAAWGKKSPPVFFKMRD